MIPILPVWAGLDWTLKLARSGRDRDKLEKLIRHMARGPIASEFFAFRFYHNTCSTTS